jgi:5-aminopentanamidase
MPVRIAALQTAGSPADVEANVRELAGAAATASAGGASLLITPELFLTGYDIGDEVRRLAQEDLLSACQRVAVGHRIALIVGYPELAPDGSLYNSAAFIDPAGVVLDVHRKTHLFGELDRTYFAEGDRAVSVVDHQDLRIATMICYDVEFPENARMAALAGAHLIAVPTAQMEPFGFVADTLVRARAWENQVYVAYANHDGVEGSTTYVGRSSIVGPDGSVLDRIESGTGLAWADVDPEKVRQAQLANPYLADIRPVLYGELGFRPGRRAADRMPGLPPGRRSHHDD